MQSITLNPSSSLSTVGFWHITISDKDPVIMRVFSGVTIIKKLLWKWKCKLHWKRELRPFFFYGVQMTTIILPLFFLIYPLLAKTAWWKYLRGQHSLFSHIRAIPSTSMFLWASNLQKISLFNIYQTTAALSIWRAQTIYVPWLYLSHEHSHPLKRPANNDFSVCIEESVGRDYTWGEAGSYWVEKI